MIPALRAGGVQWYCNRQGQFLALLNQISVALKVKSGLGLAWAI